MLFSCRGRLLPCVFSLAMLAGCYELSIKHSKEAYRSGDQVEKSQAGRVKEATIARDALDVPEATLTGVFVGDGEREEQPKQADASQSVLDSARLVSVDPEVCFEVLIQTEMSFDAPLDQLEPRCELDGRRVAATVREDRARTFEYWYRVPVYVLWTTERVFHVAMRYGTMCCPGPVNETIGLTLSNRMISLSDDRPWLLEYRWNIR